MEKALYKLNTLLLLLLLNVVQGVSCDMSRDRFYGVLYAVNPSLGQMRSRVLLYYAVCLRTTPGHVILIDTQSTATIRR